jgi:putative transferase (TIGR04331 family)
MKATVLGVIVPKKILVLTALDSQGIHEGDENVVLLGEWCRPEDDDSLGHLVCTQYHWLDREKFRRDMNWLQSFYDKKLTQVACALNELHKIDKSIDYWRILIGPSLGTLITILWDRWESLSKATLENKSLEVRKIALEYSKQIPFDHFDLLLKGSASHEFNQFLLQKIAEFQGLQLIQLSDDQEIVPSKADTLEKKGLIEPTLYLLKTILKKFSLEHFVSSRKVIFYWDRLPTNIKLRIAWNYERCPFGYTPGFKWSPQKKPHIVNGEFRKKELTGVKNSDFEKFLDTNIFAFIPMTVLEGYQRINSLVSRRKLKGSIIFTAGAHLIDDNFKVWAAEQVESDNKVLIHSPHGGAIPHRFVDFDHHRNIGIRAKWSDNLDGNEVRVFPNILFEQRRIRFREDGCKLSLVGYEGPLYIVRPENAAWSSLTLEYFAHTQKFIDNLDSLPRSVLNIRPYPDRGWNLKAKYVTRYGESCLTSQSNYLEDISQSRIIVCTYPQTTFMQAMESGRPTLLLFQKDIWDFEFPYDLDISQYYTGKMFFEDPVQAALHINQYWLTIDEWWNSTDIVVLRKKFRQTFCYDDSDPIQSYVKAFSRVQPDSAYQ